MSAHVLGSVIWHYLLFYLMVQSTIISLIFTFIIDTGSRSNLMAGRDKKP